MTEATTSNAVVKISTRCPILTASNNLYTMTSSNNEIIVYFSAVYPVYYISITSSSIANIDVNFQIDSQGNLKKKF